MHVFAPSYLAYYCRYCITDELNLSLHILVGGSVFVDFFMIILGSKTNSYFFLTLTISNTYLQIYITTVHFEPHPTNPDGKGCLIASKLIKEYEKHIYCKKLFWLIFLRPSME
jgi:hypothetical protein